MRFGKNADYTKATGAKVEDSCGCVFCDLGLEPGYRTDGTTREYYHATKHGNVPCTKPR